MKTIAEKVTSLAGKFKILGLGLLTMFMVLAFNNEASAHCDGIDGPVIKAAQKALELNNVDLVLVWVKKDDEAFIRNAFEKTIKLRNISPETKEIADTYFFETLVRIHRAGEGAPYTGLKPAGINPGPAITAADSAVATGSATQLWSFLSTSMHNQLHEKFMKTSQLKNYQASEVEKGRDYVNAYVGYVHFVEKLYDLTQQESAHGLLSGDKGHVH